MSIVEYYEEQPIEFIVIDGKKWISTNGISKGLGVSKDVIKKIFKRHRDELDDFSNAISTQKSADRKLVKMSPTLNYTKTRIFDESGFILICMFSKSPKAKLFRKWAVEVLRKVGRQGYYITPELDKKSLIDFYHSQIQSLQQNFEESQQNYLQLIEKNEKYEAFIQKYEEERLICDETMKEIRSRVYWYQKTNNFWLWAHLRKKFNYSKLGRLPEIRAIAVLKYLKNLCNF
ncbi:BRO family protein [Candidatus Lokiarchaeum ossiferum]|uniref:BRO family protein n=1 Tax=Candidatus Lokiarchaeum ossiferum TaxID=2951803 RepID=UPI00352E6198